MPTTPEITWSTEIRTVRSVSEELRSSRRSCGACAWPTSRREMRSAWAAFAAPTVSQRPSTESRLRATKSAAVIASRISAASVAVGLAQMKILDHGAGDAGNGLVVQQADQRVDEDECDRVERRDQDAVERDELQAPALAGRGRAPTRGGSRGSAWCPCERSSSSGSAFADWRRVPLAQGRFSADESHAFLQFRDAAQPTTRFGGMQGGDSWLHQYTDRSLVTAGSVLSRRPRSPASDQSAT